MVLYTDKPRTSALYKSLSLRFKGRLAFAEVSSKAADVVESQSVTQFPKLVVMKAEEVEEYSGGPRCFAVVAAFQKTCQHQSKSHNANKACRHVWSKSSEHYGFSVACRCGFALLREDSSETPSSDSAYRCLLACLSAFPALQSSCLRALCTRKPHISAYCKLPTLSFVVLCRLVLNGVAYSSE